MPTNKPRVAVTIEPEVFETIERLARLRKCSKARVIADLLETVHEPLRVTADMMEQVAQAPDVIKAELMRVVCDLEALMGAGRVSDGE